MKIASNCEKSEFFNSDTATVILTVETLREQERT